MNFLYRFLIGMQPFNPDNSMQTDHRKREMGN